VTIEIHNESPADVAAIRALTEAVFTDAPHSSHTEHLIIDALRAAGALTLSLVAETDGGIVGHVAISPVTISDGSQYWFGLGPVSVLPSYQRQGIGSQLIKRILSALRENGAAGCVVLGDPAFYRRFGFKPESGLVLPDVPAEYFQALSFGTDVPRGELSYHQGFDVTG